MLENKLCSIHLLHIGKLNNPSSGKERLLRHKYKHQQFGLCNQVKKNNHI